MQMGSKNYLVLTFGYNAADDKIDAANYFRIQRVWRCTSLFKELHNLFYSCDCKEYWRYQHKMIHRKKGDRGQKSNKKR